MSKDKRMRETPLQLQMPFSEALERFASVNTRDLQETPLEKAQPFVKWAGGKRSLLSEIEKYLPMEIKDYYEPFLGGGAVFFHIQERLKSAFLSDTNLDLILSYQAIKKDPEKLIEQLRVHKRNHGEEYYYKIRKQVDLKDPIRIAARLIYLNRTCYNGLYRVNKKGEFNVPMGNYKNPGIVQEANIRLVNVALQNAKIAVHPYNEIDPKEDDFVYCDPPYHSQNGNGFTSYTKDAFGEVEQTGLRDFALELHNKGVKVMLSNANSKFIRDLYKNEPFHIRIVHAPRLVNSKGSERSSVEEVLITTYE